jgi:small-conductance mechanosensitive channel
MSKYLPPFLQEWLSIIVPGAQILVILLVGWLLLRLTRRLMQRLGRIYSLPPELILPVRRLLSFFIYAATVLAVLGRLGVSGTVLWTAFTGFAAVGAVAFFAAWSVLSNIFCTLLIITTRPFRLHDYIELLESGEKPGFKGHVRDINLIFTTLQEPSDSNGSGSGPVLQIPNSLFFQRPLRRWPRGTLAPPWIERHNENAEHPLGGG